MVNTQDAKSIVFAHSILSELMKFNNEEFIERAYLVLLKRPSDSVGFQYYFNRLNLGINKGQILLELASSSEAKVFLENKRLIELINKKYKKSSLLSRYLKNSVPKKVSDSYYLLRKQANMLSSQAFQLLSNNHEGLNNDKNIEAFNQLVIQQNKLIEHQTQLIQQISQLIAPLDQKDTKESENSPDELSTLKMSLTEKKIFKKLKLSTVTAKTRGN